MRNRSDVRRRVCAAALLLAPPALLGLLRLLAWADTPTALATLAGCGVAAVGGLLSGVIAEYLLHRGRGGRQLLIGIIATTAVGVITIGYIYLVDVRGPMTTIDTAPRVIHQFLTFAQFLLAQGAGILLPTAGEASHRLPS